jgi:hypothetical protein
MPTLTPRKNDKLGNLPAPDQQRLLDWLHAKPYHEVRDLAARPAPEGLDLHTSITALANYYLKHAQDQAFESALAAGGPDPVLPAALDAAIFDILQQKVFLEVISPHTNFSDQRALGNYMLRRASLQLREQQFKLKEKQFELETRRVDIFEKQVNATLPPPPPPPSKLSPEEQQRRMREILSLDPPERDQTRSFSHPSHVPAWNSPSFSSGPCVSPSPAPPAEPTTASNQAPTHSSLNTETSKPEAPAASPTTPSAAPLPAPAPAVTEPHSISVPASAPFLSSFSPGNAGPKPATPGSFDQPASVIDFRSMPPAPTPPAPPTSTPKPHPVEPEPVPYLNGAPPKVFREMVQKKWEILRHGGQTYSDCERLVRRQLRGDQQLTARNHPKPATP